MRIKFDESRAIMITLIILMGFLFIAFQVGCSSNGSENEKVGSRGALKCDPDNGSITLPEGFCAFVVADDIGRARHLTVNENGDIYVMLREEHDGHGIAALRDTTGDGRADVIGYFGDYTGTGIQIHQGYLYFSSTTAVYRYKLQSGQLIPKGEPEQVIGGFPMQNQHAAKPFTFDDQGNVYVTVGAPANACQEQMRTKGSPGMDPCPLLERHGGIWRFDAIKTGQTQQKDGYRYATGIRHAVALRWNPGSKKLYAVQHGRDQLHQLWPEYYTVEQSAELPAEEFFLIEDGSNFGWPYCYYDQIQGKKVLAPEYGGNGEKVGRCGQYANPIMAFPGHYAPNDLLFYSGNQFPQRFQNGAFIAFHGSWNRAPLEQKGYQVAFVPFEKELPSADWVTFADGFAGEEHIDSPGEAEYRPMGLAQGSDGSLYISDSVKGRIWRVIYVGKNEM